MRIRAMYGRGRRSSIGALGVLALAALVGACGDRVVEEEPVSGDVELALTQEAEPELADVADELTQENEPPVTRTPAEAPRESAPAPRQPEPVPEESAPEAETPAVETSPFVPEVEPEERPKMALTAGVGSEFEAVLLQELSTKTSRPGDRFRLRVSRPLIDANYIVMQENSYINGEVTAVQKSGARGEEAVIKVTFHSAELLGGTWPLSASVVEAEPETEGRYNTGDKAARIGAGAVAGAILGRVIGGNSKGTVIGAAVGAAAGTAITLVTEDVDAVLPEGSTFRLRLDKPFTVMVASG